MPITSTNYSFPSLETPLSHESFSLSNVETLVIRIFQCRNGVISEEVDVLFLLPHIGQLALIQQHTLDLDQTSEFYFELKFHLVPHLWIWDLEIRRSGAVPVVRWLSDL